MAEFQEIVEFQDIVNDEIDLIYPKYMRGVIAIDIQLMLILKLEDVRDELKQVKIKILNNLTNETTDDTKNVIIRELKSLDEFLVQQKKKCSNEITSIKSLEDLEDEDNE